MVTIHRAHGLRFVSFLNDHEPVHVHVIGDGDLKVNLSRAAGLPELVWAIGIKTADRRRAMDIVRDNQADFLARWHEIHGGEA